MELYGHFARHADSHDSTINFVTDRRGFVKDAFGFEIRIVEGGMKKHFKNRVWI